MPSSQCAFSQRKVVSQFQKWNKQLCVLFMPDLLELHRTNKPKAEQIRATRLGYRPFICSDRQPATPLYTVLGDTVKKVVEFTAESITSLSNLVRSIQIMLKLQTKLLSEQTPLMWKPRKHCSINTSPPFTMDLT